MSPSSDLERPDNTNVGTTDKAIFGRLYAWLTKNGADLRKVYFDPVDRILRVRKTIRPQERILTVPPKLFMSTLLAKQESGLIRLMQRGGLEPGTHTLISVLLLEEMKKQKTFWQPYLDVLPKEYGDIPIFWSPEEKAELQGDALARHGRRIATLQEDYHRIVEVCPGFSEFCTVDEFMWARTAVITRTFGLRVDDAKITANLPIDFLMHANIPDTTWGFDQESYCYHITAKREIQKDHFLTITYGRKANARFLVNYGFCLEQNSRNKGTIYIPSASTLENPNQPENVQLAAEKCELMISMQMVTDLLKRIRDLTKGLSHDDPYWEKERKAIQLIQDLCQEGLDKFPTTLEHDRQRMDGPVSQNTRNAMLARMGEKGVLDFYCRLTGGLLEKITKFRTDEKAADDHGRTKLRNSFFIEYLTFIKKFTLEHVVPD